MKGQDPGEVFNWMVWEEACRVFGEKKASRLHNAFDSDPEP